jgi:hypothetical protein
VAISGGTLYLQAGRELALLSLAAAYQGFRRLPEGRVVAMGASAVEFAPGQFEPGVAVVLFHEESGYRVRQYSARRQETEKQDLSKLVNFFTSKKYLPFRHFEVLVPNLIALVFLSESEFCLFDLQAGEIVESSKSRLLYSKLPPGEGAVVRWREHVRPEGFSKSLILTLAVSSSIEVFFICLKFHPQFAEKLGDAALVDLHGGEVIDWPETQVAPYLCLQAPGTVL